MSTITTQESLPPPSIPMARPLPGRPGGPAAAQGGMTGRDFVRVIRKRKWLILIGFFAALGATLVGTYLWRTYAPLYTAQALLEVSTPRTNIYVDSTLYPQEIMDRQTAQMARLISRESVFNDAVSDPRLQATKYYADSRVNVTKRLQKDIDVGPITKTSIISISMTGTNREELADIVNAVANAALADVSKTREDERRSEMDQLSKQLFDPANGLNAKLDEKRKDQRDLLVDASINSLQGTQDKTKQQIQDLTPKINNLRAAQAQADKVAETMRAMAEAGTLNQSAEVKQMLEMDNTLRGLKTLESQLVTELDDSLARFGKDHPYILKIQSRLKSVRNQIAEMTNVVSADACKAIVLRSEQQRQEITAQLLGMRADLNVAEQNSRDIQTRLAKLEELSATIRDLEEKRNKLSARTQELALVISVNAPARLRQSAIMPKAGDPSQPKWPIMIGAGLFLGLLVGFGLAFILELMDTSIKGPSDISRRFDLPLLGMVPHADDLDEEIEDLRLAFQTHPASLIGEAFRQIRTCLMFSGPASQRRTLLVTSPLPNDGRTTIALNLGAACARHGRKVLVIDANFRQPMIQKLFPQAPAAGLSSVLVGQCGWQGLTFQVEPNLWVMSAGPLPPNPAELLGSEAMQQFISEVATEFDQVLFDGAPVLVVTDSSILATRVNGVILAVRAGANTHGVVARSKEVLSKVRAHMLGVVLNGMRVTAGGYLRKNYETFYEYHQPTEADLPAPEPKAEERPLVPTVKE